MQTRPRHTSSTLSALAILLLTAHTPDKAPAFVDDTLALATFEDADSAGAARTFMPQIHRR